MSEQEVKQALRQWVSKKSKVQVDDLRDDTPLIEQRILTSLQVMDLILHLERLGARPVELSRLKPGAFTNINSIWVHFFAEVPHGS
jgi:acyl carrier protein